MIKQHKSYVSSIPPRHQHQPTSTSTSSHPNHNTTSSNTNNDILCTSPTSSDGSDSKFVLPTTKKDSSNPNQPSSSSNSVNNFTSISPTGRQYCSDRKGFFDHYKPHSFLISSCRVTILQASQVLTSYLTDTLEYETELEEQLVQGQITNVQYDLYNKQWSEKEWNNRWDKFWSNKVLIAIGKFQLLTMFMRFYEFVLSKSSKIDLITLDKLTKDTFSSALRKSQRLKEYNHAKQYGSSGNGNSTQPTGEVVVTVQSNFDVFQQMFHTCLYANAITFLSDFTVQQCILLYGYYKFFISRQRERRMMRLSRELELKEIIGDSSDKKKKEDDDENDLDNDNESLWNIKPVGSESSVSTWHEGEQGGLVLSFFYKTAQTSLFRAIGLVSASLGGAFGSVILPGWGTLFGTQMGDAAAGALLEELEK